MHPWQIELLKAAGLTIIGFCGGYGAYWLKFRAGIREAERQERERQTEYETFKKKRRLIGGGQVEKVERAAALTELLIKQKEHGISLGTFEEAKTKIMGSKAKRTKAETTDPAGGVGPNGHRIGYLPNGDKVEWIPSDEEPGEEWPMLLRRNDNDILAAYHKFWDMVWWNRSKSSILKADHEGGNKASGNVIVGIEAAKRIEDKYGLENLIPDDDFDFGLMSGRLSALSWVMGSEWEESLDT